MIMVLCLIILFSMTLIGASSMDSTVLELKMSNVQQQQVVALNRAEATLRAAEDRIDALVSDGTVFDFENSGDGFYPRLAGPDVRKRDWSSVSAEDGPIVSDNSLDDDDSYVVTYEGAKTIPGETIKESVNGTIIGGAAHSYRNTTRSAAGRSAVRIVQSIYVTMNSP